MTGLLETQIEDILIENLGFIEPNLKLLNRQFNTCHDGCKFETRHIGPHKGCKGKIDILCLDKSNNLVVIELKRTANRSSVSQVCKYPTLLKHIFPLYKGNIKTIICCLKSTKETPSLCKENEVKYIELNYESLIKAYELLLKNKSYSFDYNSTFLKSHRLFKEFCKLYPTKTFNQNLKLLLSIESNY